MKHSTQLKNQYHFFASYNVSLLLLLLATTTRKTITTKWTSHQNHVEQHHLGAVTYLGLAAAEAASTNHPSTRRRTSSSSVTSHRRRTTTRNSYHPNRQILDHNNNNSDDDDDDDDYVNTESENASSVVDNDDDLMNTVGLFEFEDEQEDDIISALAQADSSKNNGIDDDDDDNADTYSLLSKKKKLKRRGQEKQYQHQRTNTRKSYDTNSRSFSTGSKRRSTKTERSCKTRSNKKKKHTSNVDNIAYPRGCNNDGNDQADTSNLAATKALPMPFRDEAQQQSKQIDTSMNIKGNNLQKQQSSMTSASIPESSKRPTAAAATATPTKVVQEEKENNNESILSKTMEQQQSPTSVDISSSTAGTIKTERPTTTAIETSTSTATPARKPFFPTDSHTTSTSHQQQKERHPSHPSSIQYTKLPQVSSTEAFTPSSSSFSTIQRSYGIPQQSSTTGPSGHSQVRARATTAPSSPTATTTTNAVTTTSAGSGIAAQSTAAPTSSSRRPARLQQQHPYSPPPATAAVAAAAAVAQQQQQQQVRQLIPATSTTPWVRQFLSTRPKDALLPIPREYLSDGFNLVQLAPIVERLAMIEASKGGRSTKNNNGVAAATSAPGVAATTTSTTSTKSSSFPFYKNALRLILMEEDNVSAPPYIQRAAEALYLLVHARYIISPRGLDMVRRVLKSSKSMEPVFGRCPRSGCRGMPLLPMGETDDYDFSTSPMTRAKRYCCCCGEKFFMWDSKIDGCAWGPSFCHLFLMTYGEEVFPELVTIRTAEEFVPKSERTVTPTVFGFRLHPTAKVRYPTREASYHPPSQIQQHARQAATPTAATTSVQQQR